MRRLEWCQHYFIDCLAICVNDDPNRCSMVGELRLVVPVGMFEWPEKFLRNFECLRSRNANHCNGSYAGRSRDCCNRVLKVHHIDHQSMIYRTCPCRLELRKTR